MQRQTTSKGSKVRQRQKTGAPPLFFPLKLVEGISSLRNIVRATQKERDSSKSDTTMVVTRQVFLGLVELAERIMSPRWDEELRGTMSAADGLASMGIAAATFLEDLAHSDLVGEKLHIQFAARQKTRWPVLLRIASKQKGKGDREPTLVGAAKAKDYLCELGLGQEAPVKKRALGISGENIFSQAAEFVLVSLQRWREHGVQRLIFEGTATKWARSLWSLELPLTKCNVDEWWAVAKVWLDEQWEANREVFRPLIAACKSKGKSLAGSRHELIDSEIRRTVIDLRLKEAFHGLAKFTDL